MKKRIIAMLLSICLLFSLLPLGVIAVDESYGISEDGTVEETEAPEATEETVPETSAPTEETVPETTEDNSVITDTSLRTSVDGKSFGVTGESIPEGAEFVVSIPQEDLTDALASLGLNNENISFFDISIEYEGEKWQPGGAVMFAALDDEPAVSNIVTLSVGGLDVSEGDEVIVYHLFDSVNAIANAYSLGLAQELDVTGNEHLFAAELEAAQMAGADEGIIFYEIINATVGNGGTVTFETGSFSRYVIATGNTTKGAQANIEHLIMQNGVTNYYYVMPNTTLTLYSSSTTQDDDYDIHLGSSTNWTIDSAHNALGLSAKSSRTYVVKIPANASTSDYTVIKANGGTARIYVRDKQAVVAQALKSDQDNGNKVYEVYLTCITDPHNGLPGEPGVNTRDFNIVRSDLSVHKSSGSNTGNIAFSAGVPSNIIDSSIATESQFVTSTDGTCTLGLVDPSGILTKSYIKLTTAQWNAILKNLATTRGSNGWVYATDGTQLKSSNYTNYVIVPYVIKLQTVSGFTWNIDCYVVPKTSSVSLSYNFNLPSGRYTDEAVPATQTGYSSFSATIKNTFGKVNNNVTLTDKDEGEYKYRFLGWGLTASSGRNDTYDPGKTVTITQNTMLYAQWQPLYDYRLEFDRKSGTGGPSPIDTNWLTEKNHQFEWSDEPDRKGYTFLGWSTGNDTTVEITAGTKAHSFNGTAGKLKTVTLYAVWDKDITINYTTVGPDGTVGATYCGSVSRASETLPEKTGTAQGSTATAKTGYEFVGWYLDQACTKPVPTNQVSGTTFKPAKASSGLYAAATYYAKFVEKEATINYVAETGGTVSRASETLKVWTGTPAGSTAAPAEDYTFDSWYNEAGTKVSSELAFKPTKTSSKMWDDGTTYTAKFNENDVTINYQVVGPTDSGTVDLNDGTDNKVTSTSETVKVLTGTAKGATAAPTSGAYKFVGWYEDADCTQLITTDASYTPAKVNKNVAATYYAKFDYQRYDLTVSKTVTGGTDAGQQFIFNISGSSADGKITVNTSVVVAGGSSVTIQDLPVGNYTVTEDTSWSWRYDVVGSAAQSVYLDSNKTASFTNNRSESKWLDFETMVENFFNALAGSTD